MTGTELLLLRRKQKVKQAALASEIGTTQANVSRWERERAAISPAYKKLIRLYFKLGEK